MDKNILRFCYLCDYFLKGLIVLFCIDFFIYKRSGLRGVNFFEFFVDVCLLGLWV